ncbi:MAG TPA: sodium:proton antiporter [Eubacteriaceae bacterium]|nr:sodium:proton antiporter [Eubacteriaceae bacterium]
MNLQHIISLLLIGYIVYTIDKKQENFPAPTVLLLIGMGLSLFTYFDTIDLTETMIYHLFIPALLFVSAYKFPIQGLLKNRRMIFLLATLGLFIHVVLLGALTYGLSLIWFPVSFLGAMLISAILTPTDPISVVSIIKKSSISNDLAHIVEGESMFNDGTSVVVFTALLQFLAPATDASIGAFVYNFVSVSIGGLAIGIVLGYIMTRAIHFSEHNHYQVMLSIILAYGSFLLAEALSVSGVLAVVASGMMLSHAFHQSEKEAHFRDLLDGFWEIAEVSLLALLYLLIGIEVTDYLSFQYMGIGFALFIFTIIARYITIYIVSSLVKKHNWRYNLLISWSGLKGSMSVFLILTLHLKTSVNVETESLVAISFTVVLLSLIVQSLTLSKLTKRLIATSTGK